MCIRDRARSRHGTPHGLQAFVVASIGLRGGRLPREDKLGQQCGRHPDEAIRPEAAHGVRQAR
eukprot:2606725-Prorocentrum_lima.AAC.1